MFQLNAHDPPQNSKVLYHALALVLAQLRVPHERTVFQKHELVFERPGELLGVLPVEFNHRSVLVRQMQAQLLQTALHNQLVDVQSIVQNRLHFAQKQREVIALVAEELRRALQHVQQKLEPPHRLHVLVERVVQLWAGYQLLEETVAVVRPN